MGNDGKKKKDFITYRELFSVRIFFLWVLEIFLQQWKELYEKWIFVLLSFSLTGCYCWYKNAGCYIGCYSKCVT